MKKYAKYACAALCGAACSGLMLLAARMLIRHLVVVFAAVSGLFGLDENTKAHLVQAFAQLRTAMLASPWLPVLLAGAVLGVLCGFVIFRCKRRVLAAASLCVILLLPALLLNVWLTEVNGVRLFPLRLHEVKTPAPEVSSYASQGDTWHFGFGRRQIVPPENRGEPLYIAGYNSGVEITGVLDYCEARAVWLDVGDKGILLIGVDCVALDSGSVKAIRERLQDVAECAAINVYSTHTHAGIDTLGLWGPLGADGKNDAYMERLICAAEEAAHEAIASRTQGTLHFGFVQTENMYRDSRDPQVYDAKLYQLRFASEENSGLRLLFYGAHAESLRGSNTLLSRDFAGALCDRVTEATGDNALFLPGAVGGLIMTKQFVDISSNADAVQNLQITAEKLTDYALAIASQSESVLAPDLAFARSTCVVPMDNIGFVLFRYLGILGNEVIAANSATGYGVKTEVSVLKLDDLAIALIPGEAFPELVYGGEFGDASPQNANPEPLCDIAARYGVERLLVVGLCNDEVGYIVPPSDFLLNERLPYIEKAMDYKGENHYEETNSVGPECAFVMAETFERTLRNVAQ